jgi:hypothetical protein
MPGAFDNLDEQEAHSKLVSFPVVSLLLLLHAEE